MKRALLATTATLLTTTAHAQDLPQADNEWFTAGQATLEEKASVTPNTNRAKNVIIMISDGNGVGSNYITRLYAGQQAGNLGDEHVLPFETFPHLALSKTYNTNGQTPDSAGTGTAMHAGVKTKAGVLGVDDSIARGDCAGVEGAAVLSLGEILAEQGKAVGIVSTARITHATPASVYAKSADRNFENNSDIPEGCDQADIATQLIDAMEAGTIDVAMGGGRRNFILESDTDDEGDSGRRTDANLIDRATGLGAAYAWNDTTAAELPLDGTPILGLFHDSHMQYEADRDGEPSLAEMAELAIKSLDANGGDNGYFLSIEAGRVDHANHANNAARMVTDGVAFAEAVALVDELTNDEDTLIIVTADHEHAIATNGYCGRGSNVLGICYEIDPAGTEHLAEPVMGNDGKAFTVVGYLNGSSSILREDQGWSGSRPDITQEEVTDIDYVQQALVPKNSESHSGEDVAIYAKGPFAHLVNGTVEQNYIFHVMHHAATAE